MRRSVLTLLSIPVFAVLAAAFAMLAAASPAAAQCPADVTGNGVVDVAGDLTLVILDYGCTGATCRGDVNGNGYTGENDFIAVSSNLGPCPIVEDLNGDGSVNIADMQLVAQNDGLNCLADADNDTDVDEFDAYIISTSIEGSPDALPLALADVDGDGDLDNYDLYATFLAMGTNCIFDVDRDGTVEGEPGEDDFDQVCAAAGHC